MCATDDPKKTQHLLALDGAKERLCLFKEDLLEEGSFDSAIDGCEGVFHTASPVLINVTDPQHWYKLSKILAEEAAWKFAKVNGIDMVTVNPGWVIGPLFQPTFNATVEPILKYVNRTTHARDERALDAVVPVWVDVRDTANAHVLAFENPSANGRYCLVGSTISCSKVMKILPEIFPNLILPDNSEDDHDEPLCQPTRCPRRRQKA
ncbi:Tetraketide alpha-pyrone reductase 1 [Morella rubra]|uniref:Tetraketide alpha-pyrone reductase 1 n=1 Tax=Morella rubra TaxID=262757 RepID=A0A6A1VT76_9ROSI|nr:Tetraketide alpha-pyrone reductase 1 [Morella rubra]